MFKTIIVGRGLFGAAAARHLSRLQEGVAVIGPDEPADQGRHQGVFASHYDEGRMTRIVDAQQEWSITAKRSIERYWEIEAESGIAFFQASGYLGLAEPGLDWLATAETTARANGSNCARLTAQAIAVAFPFLAAGDRVEGLTETGTAGHISPRALVRAEAAIAARQGAEIIDETATAVRLLGGIVEVTTDGGRVAQAERVLIAAGGFTNACGLLPRPLEAVVFGRTVVLFRIPEAVRSALTNMPTLGHIETGAYILPPIRYPDGHHYLKIGMGTPEDIQLRSQDELEAWFRGNGAAADRAKLTRFACDLIPLLKDCPERHSDSCVVTATPSGLPTIDFVHEDRIAVAVGGNGKGAKSADDWGYAAALLVSGAPWDHPVPRARLAARFA